MPLSGIVSAFFFTPGRGNFEIAAMRSRRRQPRISDSHLHDATPRRIASAGRHAGTRYAISIIAASCPARAPRYAAFTRQLRDVFAGQRPQAFIFGCRLRVSVAWLARWLFQQFLSRRRLLRWPAFRYAEAFRRWPEESYGQRHRAFDIFHYAIAFFTPFHIFADTPSIRQCSWMVNR